MKRALLMAVVLLALLPGIAKHNGRSTSCR